MRLPPARMDATAPISRLDMLANRTAQRAQRIREQCDSAAEQWQGLSRTGGQRADHAAELLATLQDPIRDLQQFLATVQQQLETAIVDPFGNDDGTGPDCDGPADSSLSCHASETTQPRDVVPF